MNLQKFGLLLIGIAPLSILADSSVALIPSGLGILPNKVIASIEWMRKEYAPITFEGNIKASGVWYNNVSLHSEPTSQESVGLYVISPWAGRFRYAFMLHPLTSQGIKTLWNTQLAAAQAEQYELSYQMISAAVCTPITPQLYAAAAFNVTQMKAMQKLSYAPSYDVRMDGEDYAPTLSLSLLWRPHPIIALAVSGSTKNTMHLKGNTDGQSGAYRAHATDRLDIPLPAEGRIDAMLFLSDTWQMQLGVKKKYWSAYKTQDIQIDDPTLEAAFGKPVPKNWKDTVSTQVTVTYSSDPFAFQLGSVLYSGTNDEHSATLAQPMFGGKSFFTFLNTKISRHLRVGVKVSRDYPDAGYADTSSLIGTITPGIRDTLSISTKWEW